MPGALDGFAVAKKARTVAGDFRSESSASSARRRRSGPAGQSGLARTNATVRLKPMPAPARIATHSSSAFAAGSVKVSRIRSPSATRPLR